MLFAILSTWIIIQVGTMILWLSAKLEEERTPLPALSRIEPSGGGRRLFDDRALPPYSTITGRFDDGCPVGDTDFAFESSSSAIKIEKPNGILANGSGLINSVRLEAYDYDEIMGLVAAFDDAYVTGGEPVVYDCHVKYRPGGSPAKGKSWDLFSHKLATHPEKVVRVNGTAVLIAQFWGYGYYHWFVECFLRLAMVKDYLDAHPDARIIEHRLNAPDENSNAIYDLIDIDPERFISYEGQGWLMHVERLLVPSATAPGRANVRAARMMNGAFRRAIERRLPDRITGWSSSPPPKVPLSAANNATTALRIVVQRRMKGARSMNNGDTLVRKIRKSYPDAIVEEFLPNTPIWETFRMHHDADVVVAPHGAGQANAMFMRPGSDMIEIYTKVGMGKTKEWVNPCHRITSEAVGVRYHVVRSRSGSHGSPMEVDIPVVMEAIANVTRALLLGG